MQCTKPGVDTRLCLIFIGPNVIGQYAIGGGDGWIRTNDLALMKRPLCL